MFLVLVVLALFSISSGYRFAPKTIITIKHQNVNLLRRIIAFTSASTFLISSKVTASQGSVQPATDEDAKAAVKQILMARDGTIDMEKLLVTGDFAKIALMLSSKTYTDLSKSYDILVRSNLISKEDKVSLGTIKRYGIVADALIMQGGLAAELRAGGFEVAGGAENNQDSIIVEEADDEEVNSKKIEATEVKKYIKLFKDSLQDICRIAEPILSKK